MNAQSTHISQSIDVLNNHLIQIAQVEEWADLMGFPSVKKISRRFLRHFEVRPCKILVAVRLKSIYRHLQAGKYSNFQIARGHSLPDEKALNKFVNYHLGCCPHQLKCLPKNQFEAKLEKFGRNMA